MKREQILLSSMSDDQVLHSKRLMDREVARRPKLLKKITSKSGQYAKTDAPTATPKRKTG